LKARTFLLILIFSIVVLGINQCTSSSGNPEVKTCRLSDGWGYQITFHDKVIIDQPFIPAIPGKKAFPTKNTALKAGNMVKERLIRHELPTLTLKDLEKIGLDSSGNLK
jgi:hypothetical protein